MLFSATYPSNIAALAGFALRAGYVTIDTVGEDAEQTADKVSGAAGSIWVWGRGCNLVYGCRCCRVHRVTLNKFCKSSIGRAIMRRVLIASYVCVTLCPLVDVDLGLGRQNCASPNL